MQNIVITKTRNNEFNKSFKSDHDAFITTLQIEKTTTIDTKHKKYAFNKVDWKDLNSYIEKNPFNPYCYSSVDQLVIQWYKWLDKVLSENVPKTTTHRSNLAPWVSKDSSHLIKIISTLKRKTSKKSTLARLIKRPTLFSDLEKSKNGAITTICNSMKANVTSCRLK